MPALNLELRQKVADLVAAGLDDKDIARGTRLSKRHVRSIREVIRRGLPLTTRIREDGSINPIPGYPRQRKDRVRECRMEREGKRKAERVHAVIEEADGAINIVTEPGKPVAKLANKEEVKPKKGKAPDYDGAVLSQAKEFSIAWEAVLNRPGLAFRQEHKSEVVSQLKRLRTLTKRLINRVEGETR